MIKKVTINASNQATDGTTALDYVDQYNAAFTAAEGESYFAYVRADKYMCFREKKEARVKTLSAEDYTDSEFTNFNFVSVDVDTLGQVLDMDGGAGSYGVGIEPAYLLVTINGTCPGLSTTTFVVPRYIIDGVPQYSEDDYQPLYYLVSTPPPNLYTGTAGYVVYNFYDLYTYGGVTEEHHGIRIVIAYNFPFWPVGTYGASILYIKPGPSSSPYNVWGATDLVYYDAGGTWADEDPWGTPINWPIDKPTTTTCTVRPKGIYKPPS